MKSLLTVRLIAVAVVVLAVVGLVRDLGGAQAPALAAGPIRLNGAALNLGLLAFIAALVWLVARYCSVNLRGQARLPRFGLLLAVVAGSLALLVTSGNLFTLALGWTVSALALAGLVSHSGSAEARRAGRVVTTQMTISSALVWSAVAISWWAGLSLDGTDSTDELGSGRGLAVAVLLLLACVIRSALVPAHRWLPETAEAPSPVSALLHAGIVNAAGIVAVLQWPLLSAHPTLLLALGVIGLITVVVCTLEQRVRPDVKGRLAASTSAQMGWMALQVGVGAPAAAVVHLMGHGAWKAWHFLRAGGAVVRARRDVAIRSQPSGAERLALTALALAPLVTVIAAALAAGVDLTTGASLTTGVGLAITMVVGHEAARVERTGLATRSAVAVIGGLAVALYVWSATAWEHSITDGASLDSARGVGSVGLVALALAGLVALALFASRLHTGSTHPIATLASAGSLAPGARLSGRAPHLDVPEFAGGRPAGSAPELSPDDVRRIVETTAQLIGPAWPLRAAVAANPLAGLEMMAFDDAVEAAENARGHQLRPSLQWFLDLHGAGVIDDGALAAAVAEQRWQPRAHSTALGVLEATRAIVDHEVTPDHALPLRGSDRAPRTPRTRAGDHAHLWSARAWHRADDVTADREGPWHLWRCAAAHGAYDVACGRRGASAWVRTLPLDATEAVAVLLSRRGSGPEVAFDAVVGAMMQAPGWAGHAQWRARRSGSLGPVIELVALHLALQSLVSGAGEPWAAWEAGEAGEIEEARAGGARRARGIVGRESDDTRSLGRVWQRALDLSARARTCAAVSDPDAWSPDSADPAESTTPTSQSVWCIDVRSERLRRHLEQTGPHETFGFAGFFGVLASAVSPDQVRFDQCPVIVEPAVQLDVAGPPLRLLTAVTRAATRVTSRPGVAFGVAEAGGWAAFAAAVTATLLPTRWRRVLDLAHGDPRRSQGSLALSSAADPSQALSITKRADMAESLLRGIGLIDAFAPVIVLCGHASTTENNAFASAYDCGACGGNSGVLNAAAMADVLNDREVRRVLAQRGIDLPDHTRVLAALHDTARDEVSVWSATSDDGRSEAAVTAVIEALDTASGRARVERLAALPQAGRSGANRSAARRATDWSEPMPEWGLAGCTAIVVGPRALTRKADLGGRVFLHSYERDQDPDGTVLTQILNAPVVVSHWIGAQYWFSAAAPAVLGAGDKTTHNLVGDVGVISGAHGDLRVGLPWQALFGRAPGERADTSHDPAHVPSRHLVVVDGDPTLIKQAVSGSETLSRLISNGWMQLVAVDGGRRLSLEGNLQWQPVEAWPLPSEAPGPISSSAPRPIRCATT